MEVVSQAFKDATKMQGRETKAIVEFLINLQEYSDGTTVASSTQASISDKDELIESVREEDKIASLERNRWKLDGSFYLPRTAEKYSFWSDGISLLDGTFTTNPYATITLGEAQEIERISVLWGQEEYPLLWKVIVNGTTTINIDSSTGNNNTVEINDTVTSLKIEIVKWYMPYYRAKIQCVDLGITKIYTDKEILNLSITEQCDHLGVELPSNTCSVTIENINKDFDILNPQGYYQYLTSNAPINIKIGHITAEGVQYVNMGKFFLDEYTQEKSKMTFSASDILTRLDKIKFYGWIPKKF